MNITVDTTLGDLTGALASARVYRVKAVRSRMDERYAGEHPDTGAKWRVVFQGYRVQVSGTFQFEASGTGRTLVEALNSALEQVKG